MKFDWDANKRQRNVRKHGMDFVEDECEKIFSGFTVTHEDKSEDYGEPRFLTIGLLQGRTISVVHTEGGDLIHIISIRKATKHERTQYFKEIAIYSPKEPDGLGSGGRYTGRRH